MRDPNPTVILIPGLGMIAWSKDKSESRVTAEFYNCAVEVMRGAEAIFLLLTQRLRQTTGQIITVDGGLQEAFLG